MTIVNENQEDSIIVNENQEDRGKELNNGDSDETKENKANNLGVSKSETDSSKENIPDNDQMETDVECNSKRSEELNKSNKRQDEEEQAEQTSKYFKDDSGDKKPTAKKDESQNVNDTLDESKDESQEDESNDGLHPRNVKELTKFCSNSSRDESYFITSEIPDICKKQPCILGIDEAGRGPVLGPMVYGICYCPKSKEDDFKETGCADSKSLTEEKRETIFDKICKHRNYIGWEVKVISPKEISNSMLRRQKVSLNEVSHNAAIGLLRRALDAGVMVTEVFVDTVGPAEKYEAKLKNLFPEISVTVAKKADSTYPIVGGASICAKVTRDVAIKSWTFSEIESSGEWGSGYPNDPVTKKFLISTINPVFGFPNIVRFSWSTAEKILEEHAYKVEWEEEESTKAGPSVKTFFSPDQKEQKQHRFFKDRCLKNVTAL